MATVACGRVVPETVAVAVVVVTPVATAFAVVPDKAVAAASVTILPLKNVVQIHILITSVELNKLVAMALAVTRKTRRGIQHAMSVRMVNGYYCLVRTAG
jgi:hypothetical protein